MKSTISKKILASVIALSMIVSLLPAMTAFAVGANATVTYHFEDGRQPLVQDAFLGSNTWLYAPLTLSEQSHFICWSASPTSTAVQYANNIFTYYVADYDCHVYAIWDTTEFTVTFNATGGTVTPVTTKVQYNKPITSWPTVTKQDFVAAGWFTKDGSSTGDWGDQWTSSDTVLGDITLYAKWESNLYKVTYSYTIWTPPASPTLPVPFGPDELFYTNGQPSTVQLWDSTNKHWHSDYVLYSVTVNGVTVPLVNFNQTYYATTGTNNFQQDCNIVFGFQVNQFTIHFDCDGGYYYSGTNYPTFDWYANPMWTVAEPNPANMYKTGNTFDYWYEMGASAPYDFSTPVTRPMTLYAHWTKNLYELKFVDTDFSVYETRTVQYGDLIDNFPPNPTKTGYTFTYWIYYGPGTRWYPDTDTVPPNDFMLMAQWTTNAHQLVFRDEDPSIVPYYDQIVAFGTHIYAQSAWERKLGFSFMHWADLNGTPWAIAPSDNVTMPDYAWSLEAKWNKLNLVNAVFDQGENIGGPAGAITATFTSTTSPADVLLNDVQFEITNAVTGENNLQVVVEDSHGSGRSLGAHPLTRIGTSNIFDISWSTSWYDYVNGDTITYTIYDYGYSWLDAYVIGTFTVTVDIPVTIRQIDGYFSPTWNSDIIPGKPVGAEYVIQLNATTRTIDGFTFTTTTAPAGVIDVQCAAVTSGVLTVVPGSTGTQIYTFKHDTKTLTVPLIYYIYNGAQLIGTVKINPQFRVYIEYGLTGGGGNYTVYPFYGMTIKEPDFLPKAGYDFDNWYRDLADLSIAWDFINDGVFNDMTLYANWNIHSYTVTYKDDDGSTLWIEYVPYHEPITNWVPVKTGWTFNYWKYESGAWWNPAWGVDRDTELTADWTQNFYNLNWYIDLGNVQNNVLAYGADVTGLVPVPVPKAGHVFSGWYTDAALTPGNEWDFSWTMPDHDVKLYAEWVIKTYTIEFDNNYGTPAPATQTKDYWSLVDRPTDPTLVGATFDGWWLDAAFTTRRWNFAGDRVGINNPGGEDEYTFKLYAKWLTDSYIVNFFNWNGNLLSNQSVMHGSDAVPPPNPTRGGWRFDGWDTVYTNVTQNLTITALFVRQVTVTFNTEGGLFNGSTALFTRTLDIGQPLGTDWPNPAPTKAGYTFGGWWDGATRYYNTTPVNGNITLFAHWLGDPVVVTYNYTEARGWMTWIDNITPKRVGDLAEVYYSLYEEPFYNGYYFLYWYIDPTDPLTPYNHMTDFLTGDTTLYARWYTTDLTVNYYYTTPSSTPYSEQVAYNSPAKYVYHDDNNGNIAIWCTDYPPTTPWRYDLDWRITTNTNLYAKWIPKEINVTYNYGILGGSWNKHVAAFDHYDYVTNTPCYAPASDYSGSNYNFGDVHTDAYGNNYQFLGWYENSALTIPYDFSQYSVPGLTLYAAWAPANTSIVKFNSLETTVDSNSDTILAFNGVHPNYIVSTLSGWVLDIDYVAFSVFGATGTITVTLEDVTLSSVMPGPIALVSNDGFGNYVFNINAASLDNSHQYKISVLENGGTIGELTIN